MEPVTAAEALERLKQGNQRLVSGQAQVSGRVDPIGADLAKGQQPFAVVLGCSDSRVPVEIVFDAGLGDLFVVRVAGNVANKSTIASVEFAILQLGVKLVVVLGHEDCGAVGAAMSGNVPGGHLESLLGHILPALDPPVEDVNVVVRRNARNSANRLLEQSDYILDAVESGAVEIVTAFYHFADGRVDFDEA